MEENEMSSADKNAKVAHYEELMATRYLMDEARDFVFYWLSLLMMTCAVGMLLAAAVCVIFGVQM